MMKLASQEVSQHKLRITAGNGDEIKFTITDGYGGWEIGDLNRPELTLKELKCICDLIYSEGVIDSNRTIRIPIKGGEAIYVRGNRNMDDDILSVVKVTVVKDKK
jgi:hypothetical protein